MITVCPQKYDPKMELEGQVMAVTMRAQAVGTAGAMASMADAALLVGCFCCVCLSSSL